MSRDSDRRTNEIKRMLIELGQVLSHVQHVIQDAVQTVDQIVALRDAMSESLRQVDESEDWRVWNEQTLNWDRMYDGYLGTRYFRGSPYSIPMTAREYSQLFSVPTEEEDLPYAATFREDEERAVSGDYQEEE